MTIKKSSPPGREILTADRNYYVRTDGSDSNNGLANTSGGAFLTIQAAVNAAAALDLSIYNVVINVATGTYTAKVQFKTTVGAGSITILGDETTPSNVIVQSTSSADNAVLGNADANGATVFVGFYIVRGLQIKSSTGTIHGIFAGNPGAIIQFKKCDFGAVSGDHLFCQKGGLIECLDNYSASGNATRHATSYYRGHINLQGKGGAITVTLTGTPTFSGYFVLCGDASYVRADNITYSGSATTTRYSVTGNSVVDTGGGGAAYFPGGTAGSTASGGQYL